MRPHAVLLAAGPGRRFGSQKLLAPWRGQPLLSHVIACLVTLRDAGDLSGATAVVPAADEAVAALPRQSGLRIVANAHPERGLSHSLRLGLGSLAALPDPPPAAVLFLGDQPAVPPEAVREVLSAWEQSGQAVVRPRYAAAPTEPGHPVLLDRDVWGLADGLTGDQGLGAALAHATHLVLHVDVDGSNPDVDTPDDLRRLPRAT